MAVGYTFTKHFNVLSVFLGNAGHSRISFSRAFLGSLFAFAAIAFSAVLFSSDISQTLSWEGHIERQTRERVEWLEESHIIIPLSSADAYFNYASHVVESLPLHNTQAPSESKVNALFEQPFRAVSKFVVEALLNLGFVFIAFWPIWGASACLAVLAMMLIAKKQRRRALDILGACHNRITSFYSGFYVPLNPNHKISGTDFSCMSMATPRLATRSPALAHKLTATLKEFEALNETNLSLVRIILAYKDYPGIVDSENGAETSNDSFRGLSLGSRFHSPANTFVNNELTLETAACDSLNSALTAQRFFRRFFSSSSLATQPTTYSSFSEFLAKEGGKLGSTALSLVKLATIKRAHAISKLHPAIVASAVLALEAGKSMTFERAGIKFTPISRFPNLQARAVIQSIESYHKEYSGDVRLVIRQAILCARRHGDLFRTFVPVSMPIPSRALRDQLEFLYAKPSGRSELGEFIELHAYLEEIYSSWRDNFIPSICKNTGEGQENNSKFATFGLIYKSVVLVPLAKIVEALSPSLEDEVVESRVSQLISNTKHIRGVYASSSRLPGFGNKVVQLQESKIDHSAELESWGPEVNKQRWLIAKEFLTKYNWLSTRIGDNAVPENGIVYALNIHSTLNGGQTVEGLSSVVPLRQRRFKEIFGPQWEKMLFPNSSETHRVEVHLNPTDYQMSLEKKLGQEKVRKRYFE